MTRLVPQRLTALRLWRPPGLRVLRHRCHVPWPAEVIFGPRQFFGLRTLWVAGYMMLLATSYIHELSFRAQVVRDVCF